ncbi:hypothetical protein QJS10_CPA01g01961 [Acorus calamus]|uniref:Uncharacterized protein n=1 Tax=Acorus calamus TaxID=4465 RepID=A0AAV9FGP5_ACOCL|nr:hypothetical protein QJS10_CPA01g01961 [Acorus calamus]
MSEDGQKGGEDEDETVIQMWKTLDRAHSFEAWVVLLEVCLLSFTYMMIISKNPQEEHVDWHSIRYLWLG